MPFLLLLWPILEIWFYVQVCALIGVGGALLLSFGTMLWGGWLIRTQGFGALMADGTLSRQGIARGMKGAQGPLFDRVCLTLAGLLLILPGFLSDLAALVLIAPAGRRWIRRRGPAISVGGSFAGRNFHATDSPPGPDIIEGDYIRLDDAKNTKPDED